MEHNTSGHDNRTSPRPRLAAVGEQDVRLQSGHRLDTVRAHLLERAGDLIAADQLYRAAALKTTSVPERNYLITKAARLRSRSA